MYYSVISVIPQNDYHLLLRFETGEEKLFNMKPYLSVGIFKALQEPSVFNTAHLSFDTVAWSNGADIDPETLYEDSVLFVDESVAKAIRESIK
jgi:hypothetical protein